MDGPLKHVKLVIFDLDGTLIQTETLVISVAKDTVRSLTGRTLTNEAIAASIGRRPLDAWQAVVDMMHLDCTAEQLFQASEPLLTERRALHLPRSARASKYSRTQYFIRHSMLIPLFYTPFACRWHEAGLLPGAARLVSHLRAAGVGIALATSTSRATLQRKLSSKPSLRNVFHAVCCGDDEAVGLGKPAPDCFLHVAQRMGVAPEDCLVVEDAACGVQAAEAAGMRVVMVPSLVRYCILRSRNHQNAIQ